MEENFSLCTDGAALVNWERTAEEIVPHQGRMRCCFVLCIQASKNFPRKQRCGWEKKCPTREVVAAMSILFGKIWRNPFSSSPPAKRPRRRRRLEVEQLEDRIVPSLALVSHYTGLDSAGVGGGGEPPDTQGAVGPSSVVETVNQGIAIYPGKSTSSGAVTDTLAHFLFTTGGLPHVTVASGDSDEQTDPFTIYDPLVQRFIVGDLDFEVDSNGNRVNDGGNALLLAVSKAANPTTLSASDWYFYEINTAESGVALQDYTGNPGYNADALVVTLNSYDASGNGLHSQVNAISMNALVNGKTLTRNTNYFQTDNSE